MCPTKKSADLIMVVELCCTGCHDCNLENMNKGKRTRGKLKEKMKKEEELRENGK